MRVLGFKRLVACALVSLCVAVPLASAQPVLPQSPDGQSSQEWVNPQARANESTDITAELVEAPPASLAPNQPLSVTVRVTNNSGWKLSNVVVTARQGTRSESLIDARTALAADSSTFTEVAAEEHVVDLSPHQSAETTLTVDSPANGQSTEVFPYLIAASAMKSDGEQVEDTERFLVPYSPTVPDRSEAAPGLSVVLPLAADVDVVPGETGTAPETPPLVLRSEQLAEQLEEGGRLDRILDALDQAEQDPETHASVCVAIDPDLLDVVDRMAHGYTVAKQRHQPKRPQRLRDSWGSSDDIPTTAGTGAEAAGQWIDRLHTWAQSGCVVALPWAGANLDAVGQTHNRWLAREALERGPATLERILGSTGLTNLVIPASGYVTAQATPILGWADYSRSTISQTGMHSAWEESSDNEDYHAPTPQNPVNVLVADNSVWANDDQVATVGENLSTVGYHDSLAATLAATGHNPSTMGYSNPAARYRFTDDSVLARDVTASAGLQLALNETDSTSTVLAMLPLNVEAQTAQMVLDSVTQSFEGSSARAVGLAQYVHEAHMDVVQSEPMSGEETPYGAPFADPAVYAETEIMRASQQAMYTDALTSILSNDPNLALTRYGYTLPLRRDQLRALTDFQRHSTSSYDDAVKRTDTILSDNSSMIQALRSAIALLPPGNVYTRTSATSPLLIVAENRLPLPVHARVGYSSDQSGRLNTPETIRVPASGSITVTMTADLPDTADQYTASVWLATMDETPISTPVDITVQTRATARDLAFMGMGLMILLALAAFWRSRKPVKRAKKNIPAVNNERQSR